mgnify:CR=1 FL=1
MTDARMEWISKQAYSLWEEAGHPHGHDIEHWAQAVREREEFERVALPADARPARTKKPLIDIALGRGGKADAGARTKASESKPI